MQAMQAMFNQRASRLPGPAALPGAALAAALAIAGVAFGETGLIPIGDPEGGNSWTQRFQLIGFEHDHIQVLLVEGPGFAGDGLEQFAPPGWYTIHTSATLLLAQGPSLNENEFDLRFDSTIAVTQKFYLQAYLDGALKNTAVAHWTGTAWNIANLGPDPGSWTGKPLSPDPKPQVTLNADQSCYDGGVGDTVVVTIDLTGATEPIVGGQFFLTFDAALTFVGAAPGPDFPWEIHLCEGQFIAGECIPMAGYLEYAVGIDFPQEQGGTTADSTMAILTFKTDADGVCDVAGLVEFDLVNPFFENKLSGTLGKKLIPDLFDLEAITFDSAPPTVTWNPPNIVVPADAGGCDAEVWWSEPVAGDDFYDNCTVAEDILVVSTKQPGDVFGVAGSPHTVIYNFRDDCGNWSPPVTFTVTVEPVNVMVVDLALQQTVVGGELTRCITFELFDSVTGALLETVHGNITFMDGIAAAVEVEVPCGNYDICVEARDELHTLRSTAVLGISGSDYVATGFEPLVGGDLNDDGLIDILDFAIFVWEFGVQYGDPQTGDTECGLVQFPHADISASGIVDSGDFSFISINFLKTDQTCPGQAKGPAGFARTAAQPQPRGLRSITVAELHRRGLGHLAIADLNGDGVVDEVDVALFFAGVRP